MLERKGSGLFYGLFMVAAAMAAVVIATFISTLAHAETESTDSPSSKSMTMICKDGANEFAASITLTTNESGIPVAGVITTEKSGTCRAGLPASALGAFGGKIDMHDFMTRAGENCANDTSFAVFVEKSADLIRHASLQVGEHVYPCARD